MNIVNTKRVIAREGLIILGIATVLYISLLFVTASPPTPKFEAKFANGDILDFYVTPKYDYSRKDKKYAIEYTKELYSPHPTRIIEELEKSIKKENITSRLVSTRCVNTTQLALSSLFIYFLSYNFLIKVLIVYLLLLLIRFILWAVRMLNKE